MNIYPQEDLEDTVLTKSIGTSLMKAKPDSLRSMVLFFSRLELIPPDTSIFEYIVS